jgi:hypothetical protein
VKNDFLVGDTSRIWRDESSDLIDLLDSRGLYKSLSLVLARREGIKVPPSLLLLAIRPDLIREFASKFDLPLMIRVDYQNRPKIKPLGGIPLYTTEIIGLACKRLLADGCLPLLHPHLDRFDDLFSCGALLVRDSDQVEVEVVGKGFDAGDLRLGIAIPDETFMVDIANGTTTRHGVIDDEAYQKQRQIRRNTARKLRAYTDFANKAGKLLGELDGFDHQAPTPTEPLIPSQYQVMPTDVRNELLDIVRRIKSGVLYGLPSSEVYVASMSYLPNDGWILWDVYGEWYFR